jgi:hypothetical protein
MDLACRMHTISRHVADHLAAPIRHRRGASLHVLGCGGRLERCPSLQSTCRVQGPNTVMVRVEAPCFTVISSPWRSRRRHCPGQRTPFCSRIWGTSFSAFRARRWSLCAQTSSRISRNDIGRSAWGQIQHMNAALENPQFMAGGYFVKDAQPEACALRHWSDHIQRLVLPEAGPPLL